MNFDFGNILMRMFQINWKHKSFSLFWLIPTLVISFLFLALFATAFFFEENSNTDGLFLIFLASAMLIIMMVALVSITVTNTSLILGVLRVERGEGKVSFMELLRDGFVYFGRAVGIILIVHLTVGAVFTVFFSVWHCSPP